MHTLHEEWRDIPGAEGAYQVSNHGRIRGLDRTVQRGNDTLRISGRPICTPPKSNGYLHFKLAAGQRSTYPMVHQAVAAAFLGPYPPGHAINHRDGDKTNNHLANLEYVTPAQNTRHAIAIGLTATGEASANAKLTSANVKAIRAAKGKRTAKALARQYGVSHLYIPLIWSNKRWRHE